MKNKTKIDFEESEYSILVVDDNITNLRVISDFLKETGYKVYIAQDGASAIEKAKYNLPDLILLDVLMPGIDGFTVCKKIKEDNQLFEIPVIFMTALSETQEKIRGFQVGGVDYITKPFQAEEVIVRVENQIKYHSVKKQLESRNKQLEKEIKDRIAAEKAFEESEALVRALINNLPFDVWAMDKDLRYILQNAVNIKNYGNNIGKKLEELEIPEIIKYQWLETDKKVLEGKSFHSEYEKNDGGLKAFESFKVPVYVNKDIVGMIGVEIDVTERKIAEINLKRAYDEMEQEVEKRTADLRLTNFKLEEEIEDRIKAEKELVYAKEKAEQAVRLKTEFLAQMSHEIRTPISTLLNFTSLLREEVQDKVSQEIQQYFPSMFSAGKRIIQTIDSILNMSELQVGAYIPEIREFEIDREILNKLYNEFKITAKSQQLDFNLKYKTEKRLIKADSYSVEQILSNIISNALKYTEKGKVEIIVSRDKNDRLTIDVKDTGIGISQELIEEIFEPFRQEEQGYTRQHEGNGLGLALVREYCKINNAEISVKSKKGSGSTFTVKFH